MTTYLTREWKVDTMNPLSLLLDPYNPRIEVPPNASQAEIRLSLLKTEQVIELAREIKQVGGLLAGERVIVAKENGSYVVLEGNRRVCACQLLLKPELIPSQYRSTFPRIQSKDLRDFIRLVQVDIAPNREAAEITITRKHTKPGVLRWLPAAQYRRIKRMLASDRTIDQIAELFGVKTSELTRLLRSSAIMDRVLKLDSLKTHERTALADPQLKTNAFTRFFTLKGVKDTLGIKYDKDGSFTSELSKPTLDAALTGIARALLFPDQKSGKQIMNTRASPADVFNAAFSRRADLSKLRARYRQIAAAGTKAKQQQRISLITTKGNFFVGLKNQTTDRALSRFVEEISAINRKKYPTAAAFLARGLLERTLRYSVETVGLDKELRKQNGGKDPGLKDLIGFCIHRHDQIFTQNVRKVLEQWTRSHKDYCDLVIHGKMFEATPAALDVLAHETRPFIESVLANQLLNVPA